MTHFLQRTALVALASGAVGAYTTPSAAQLFKPSYPIQLPSPAAAPGPAAPAARPSAPTGSAALAETPVSTVRAPAPVDARSLEPLPAPAAAAAEPIAPARLARAESRGDRRSSRLERATPAARAVSGKVIDVEGPPEIYTVKKGDTLEKIAKKLDTSVDALKDDNDLKHEALRPGQKLKGPSMGYKAYVAGSGDTLYSIARRFGVTADALRKENGLSARAAIRAGQKIRLPEDYTDHGPLIVAGKSGAAAADEPDAPAEPAPAPRSSRRGARLEPADVGMRTVTSRTGAARSVTGRLVDVEGAPERYVVKKGDTLEKIAKKLDTTVQALKEDNNLRRSTVRPGQVLKGPILMSKAYVAVEGDTLPAIAKRFSVSAETLRAKNGLSRNATIRPGQKIKLPDDYTDRGPLTSTATVPAPPPRAPERPLPPPSRFEPAPTPAAPPIQPAPLPAPAPGPAPLPSAPVTPAPAQPATPAPQPSPAPAPARPYTPPPQTRPYTPVPPPPAPTAPRPYTPPPQSRPYAPPPVTSAPQPGVSSAPSANDAQVSELGRGRFVWPLQGQIVSDFGPKAAGQRNDGINISATMGASVRAAASGDVVYAGDQVPGFGNLVLIKHPDGWVTAYGHLSRVLVKMQQHVNQSEEIGLAGATGGVTQPQLHFEIRFAPNPMERARPVDPKLVLPKG